jgi:hypothetical protein
MTVVVMLMQLAEMMGYALTAHGRTRTTAMSDARNARAQATGTSAVKPSGPVISAAKTTAARTL